MQTNQLTPVKRWMVIAVAASLSLPVFAGEPPVNDQCSGALVIPAAGAFPYKTPIVSMRDATPTGDPIPSCFNVTRAVWYKFTPSQSGNYTFSTGFDTATTALDTVLSFYASPNGCAGAVALNEVACNDDSGAANNRAGLMLPLSAGTEYYILLGITTADEGDPTQVLNVELRVDRPVPPANDACSTAEVIPSAGPFPYKGSTSETAVGLSEAGAPALSCGTGYRNVWYRFAPAATALYILSTGSDTSTTISDTIMTLYSSSSGCSGLTELACNDNGEGRGSIFRTLDAGVTYYIAVADAFSADPVVSETRVQLSVAQASAPTVATLPFSSITSTSVTLVGTVNPNGLQSRFWFEWGLTTAYGNISTTRLLLPGTTTLNTNLAVAGFSPNVTYHYRMVATNMMGRSVGADQTFIWSTNRPVLLGTASPPPSSNYRLTFAGNPKQMYLIETSSNVNTWSTLGAAAESPAGSGNFAFTHVGGLGLPNRYYRVRSP